jgi:hypothetical protein
MNASANNCSEFLFGVSRKPRITSWTPTASTAVRRGRMVCGLPISVPAPMMSPLTSAAGAFAHAWSSASAIEQRHATVR